MDVRLTEKQNLDLVNYLKELFSTLDRASVEILFVIRSMNSINQIPTKNALKEITKYKDRCVRNSIYQLQEYRLIDFCTLSVLKNKSEITVIDKIKDKLIEIEPNDYEWQARIRTRVYFSKGVY